MILNKIIYNEMAKLTDKSQMPYGQHKGVEMANVPADYLLWLHGAGKAFQGVKEYVIENLDVLEKEAERSRRKYKKR